MKNQLNTQERSPKLAESKLPLQPPLLVNIWLLILGVGLLSVAISSVAIISLTNTGGLEKDPHKQTTIATQKPAATGGNWWSTIVLLGAGVASAGAIYKWRHNLSSFPKRRLTRRQQRKRSLKQGEKIATTTEIAPIDNSLITNLEAAPEPLIEESLPVEVTPEIAVLPPEENSSSNLGEQSLAEMMDIRQHLSLAAILQDFKRPD